MALQRRTPADGVTGPRQQVRTPAPARNGGLPVAVLIGAMLVLSLGWAFKAHCYLDGGWSDGEQYTTGCYTDVVPFWTGRDVATGAVPYLDTSLEYPVLTGAQIWIEGAVGRALVGSDGSALAFLAMVTMLNAALAVWILVLLQRMGVPERRLWWWALAPPLVLYLGHNWDLLAMALVMLAIDLHRRGSTVGAGAAAGLGAAAKLFPALLVPLLVLPALRHRNWTSAVRTLGGAVGAWLAVNLPVALVAPERWAEFYSFSQQRLGTFAATWTVVDEVGLLATSVEQRNLAGTALFAIGGAAIVWAGWDRHADRAWVLLTPLLAWFLLTNKVYSPQFDLWLIPLLVLTLRRTWPLAAFVAADALVYWAEFWYLGWRLGVSPSAPYPVLVGAALLRAIVLLAIVVLVVRDHPPVWLRAPADDTPASLDVDRVDGADSR